MSTLREYYIGLVESGGRLPDSYRQILALTSEQGREVVWADQAAPSNGPASQTFNVNDVINFPAVNSDGVTNQSSRTPSSEYRNELEKKRTSLINVETWKDVLNFHYYIAN